MKKSFLLICVIASFLITQNSHALENNIDRTKPSELKVSKPNVLLIVADDLGFSDLGSFGGEIETPNLDLIAFSGVRLTNFYTMPNCSPTRSMLLTAKDSHSVGLGAMAEALNSLPFLRGKVGYEGYLNPETTTIAEKFSEAGYRTQMAGKWHLGHKAEHQPSAHGFDKSFVLLQGGADHFGYGQNGEPALETATYTQNGELAEYPVGTYSSDFYSDRLIEYLKEDEDNHRPFFAYLAFTAPHWPLQAPKELIDKYKGRYDEGPEVLRQKRLQRMKEIGLLDATTLDANLEPLDAWDEMSEEQRTISIRKMEVYAAMVDSLDQNVGKVLDYLRSSDQLENTIIVFLSDNGAEGIPLGKLISRSSNSLAPEHKAKILGSLNAANIDLEKMGTHESFLTYGGLWARAGAAPFRRYKGDVENGGIRAPAFISGPGIKGQRVIDAVLSVRDVMPTTLDLSDIPYDSTLTTPTLMKDGVNAPTAKSWVSLLNGTETNVRAENDALAWELHMKRAVLMGEWKAVYGKDNPAASNPKAPSSWKLYNVKLDPGESQNVRSGNPEIFQRLMTAWKLYVEKNGVFVPGPRKPPN